MSNRRSIAETLVLVKGGGDLATGVAHRLHRAGFPVMITEIENPTMVRRTVSFAECLYADEWKVEGVTSARADGETPAEKATSARAILDAGSIPVMVDPRAEVVAQVRPAVVVDAILAKRNLGTRIDDAEGAAKPNTGVPGPIGGYTTERLLRAPQAGIFTSIAKIGDVVSAGEAVARVNRAEVRSAIDGVLRGLLRDGIEVSAGFKVGDVDPRAEPVHCCTISDKSRAIGGGALEAIMMFLFGVSAMEYAN